MSTINLCGIFVLFKETLGKVNVIFPKNNEKDESEWKEKQQQQQQQQQQ